MARTATKHRGRKRSPARAARRSRPRSNERSGSVLVLPRREAGEIIDPVQAQRIGAVWRCVAYLSGLVAQPPWNVYRPRGQGGGFIIDPDASVSWLLNRRPNPETSAFKFRETLMRWALLRGNAYAEIERTIDRRPLWLWQLHPSRVDPVRTAAGALAYEVQQPDGSKVIIPSEDMLHIAGPSEDGIIGLPVIVFAALSAGYSAATERYGADFFANSAMPSGVLKHPKTLDDDASARIAAKWQQLHGGRRSQGMVVLEEGMEFQAIAIPNDQSQWLEARKASVEEICRWFGVPLQKVMATMQATYRNMEQFNREVVQDTGVPWIRNFEQEADYKLLSDNRGGAFTLIDTRALLRGDSVERSTYWRNLFTAGAISPNEIREAEGMAPVPGGDRRYLQVNMGPINDDGTIETPAPAQPAAEEPEEPAAEPANDQGDGEEGQGEGDGRGEQQRAGANGHAEPSDSDRLLAVILPEVRRIQRGEPGRRGARGQRGARGVSPTSVWREGGRIRMTLSDGSIIEEAAANGDGQ